MNQPTEPHIIGVLSDTHIVSPDSVFKQQVERAFADCDMIIHAGDLTDLSILEVFDGKQVFAVHGNMCNFATRRGLPASRVETIGDFRLAVCHTAGGNYDIEDRLFSRFYDADCIIFGHTHRPVNHWTGNVLYLNPGSFKGTGRYGSPGSYALLTIDAGGLSAKIQTLPPS